MNTGTAELNENRRIVENRLNHPKELTGHAASTHSQTQVQADYMITLYRMEWNMEKNCINLYQMMDKLGWHSKACGLSIICKKGLSFQLDWKVEIRAGGPVKGKSHIKKDSSKSILALPACKALF